MLHSQGILSKSLIEHLRKAAISAHGISSIRRIASYVLSFLAASISGAGGIGGGSLYLPILSLISGMDLKSAAAVSSFMVTAGSAASVAFNLLLLFFFSTNNSSLPAIDYEIALLSEPSMLLGVSAGVVCNVMFPEWLITVLFALFLGLSTLKICGAGFKFWKEESESGVLNEAEQPLSLLEGKGGEEDGAEVAFPWRKVLFLFMIWITFTLFHALVGSMDGKSMIHIRPCGVAYWLITLLQIPIALVFTLSIFLHIRGSSRRISDLQEDELESGDAHKRRVRELPMLVFPLVALLSGIMGGLFGIGGGLFINPVLLQVGVSPQVTAGTTTFMVLFSSSMSLVQFLILGMKNIDQALIFSAISFIASIVGLVIIQRAIEKSGRASLIVFSVSTVMVLSTISIACFGAIDVWRDYMRGNNMGFKLPC